MLRVDFYGRVEVSRPDAEAWELGVPAAAVRPDERRWTRCAFERTRRNWRTSSPRSKARRDPYVSGREGLNTTQMLEGADRSSKLNQAVELPLG